MSNISDKTLATQYFMASQPDMEKARHELYKLGIKSSYDKESVMIFSTLYTSKKQINSIYMQECNGLILEQKTWRPLVVPPRSLRFNIDTDMSNKFLHQGLYHVYKAEDGTCFNLYYHNDSWIISTAKGFNMNNVVWEVDTYQSIISQCLEKIGLTWESFTDQLNKKHCYSFGFKHPSFHKFWENFKTPVYKIWFIQSVDLDTESTTYLWSSDKSPIVTINNQTLVTNTISNLRELYKNASNALHNFLNTKDVCYGYILRSVNFELTGYNSDLFIESSLMRTIRRFWYENSIIEKCHENKWSKENVITLNSFLDSSNYELFQLLFPQYNHLMGNFADTLNLIINQMLLLAKNKPVEIKKYEISAKLLLQSFKDNVKFNIASTSVEKLKNIFYGYAYHPSSLDMLYNIIFDDIEIKGSTDNEVKENDITTLNSPVMLNVPNMSNSNEPEYKYMTTKEHIERLELISKAINSLKFSK